ncbi:phage tail protein [Erythrobacter sp. EC-HK427]|uniref:phage tail protein n=1 Tax=Erythrobacter sp. EC-HK427 TaxID=2038396 RepID=UPI0012518B33|nr:tail fiber protein [Erythrobacter sp. EC-HK427]VVT12789.1 conserved exported hypothetical protein [Erythrobacter sp. EC-HK427]
MSKLNTILAAAACATGLLVISAPAKAQDRYIGEIYEAGYTFCPRNTLPANGGLIPISQNTALFSLLGTTYGGDGRTTFALPDMRGRLPMHVGQGPGLTFRSQGEMTGTESNTLSTANLPSHSHNPVMRVSRVNATTRNPINAYFARSATNVHEEVQEPTTSDAMAADAIQSDLVGGNQPYSILQPSLVLQYCVVTQGIFPPRS